MEQFDQTGTGIAAKNKLKVLKILEIENFVTKEINRCAGAFRFFQMN